MTTYFKSKHTDADIDRIEAGEDIPDPCANCGADCMDHTNGRCPDRYKPAPLPPLRKKSR